MTGDVLHPLLLAGEDVVGGGEPLVSVNPADGSRNGLVSTADDRQVADAVAAAAAAQRRWRTLLPHQRAGHLLRAAALVEERIETLAGLQMRENGKTITECRGQVRSAAAILRYYAGVCETAEAELPPPRGPYLSMTTYEPYGVVVALTPWNSPLTMGAQKLGPALAAGNGVVLKPSEYTSRVSIELARCLTDTGLPAGLVSVLPGGPQVGAALVDNPDIALVSFTGGTATGRSIAERAGARLKPVILELGGKSPNIVFADADRDAALAGALTAIFSSGGQSCIAGSRLLVQRAIHDDFLAALVERTRAIRIGTPDDPASQMGPFVSFAHRDTVERFVAEAIADGGAVAAGGQRPEGPAFAAGAYYLPTIVTGLAPTARLCRGEVFGPVLAVLPFEDEADAVALANATDYGLACGIWTADYRRAWRVAQAVGAGTAWINTYKQLSIAAPFGGFKASGLGREKGIQGMRAYQQSKSIYWGMDSMPLSWGG